MGIPSQDSRWLDSFCVVGTGALARSLTRALVQQGMTCRAMMGRNTEVLEHCAQLFGIGSVAILGSQPLPASDVVFLAVSDDALRSVAAVLADGLLEVGHVVFHTSGVHSAAILEDLAGLGAHTGSFHPLQTFTGQEGKERFRGITIGIEGSEEALKVGRHIADDLLATAVVVPSDRKALYHAAAVTAGNHAIAMLATAIELWERATADAQGGRDALGPLARQSIENALALGAEAALTGPVVRGDLNTVHEHLRALQVHAEHLLPMYAAIITETVHVAMRSGRLSTEEAVAMLDVVAREVAPPSDEGA